MTSAGDPPTLGEAAFDRLDDPRVLVPRERDPLTGRLTRSGDDRPGKRRRSPDRARRPPRLSRAVVMAGAIAGVLLIAGIAFAISSGDNDDTANAPSGAGPSSTAIGDGAAAGDVSDLEGTWRFVLQSARLNFVSGRYAGTQVSVALAGETVRLEARISANDFHRVTFRPGIAGEHEISCRGDSCGTGPIGFVADGNTIAVVDRATLEPDGAGAGLCGAPPVASAGFIRMAGPSTFRFVSGDTAQSGTDCFQVLWTVVATKVS